MTFRNEAWTDSATRCGTIPQGKGREGNRKGKDKTLTSFSTHLQSPPATPVDACSASRRGGQR